MIETGLIHADCGQPLHVAAAGEARLECRACDCAVVLIDSRRSCADDEATAERVAHYLAENFEIAFLEALGLVRRYVETVFGAIDSHRSARVAGDALAGLAMLRERDPNSTN